MPILVTPLNHFNQDISRARELSEFSGSTSQQTLRDDILRSAWMMAVGACDAYFCDAYADLLSRTLRAKDQEAKVDIPDRLKGLKVPVVAIIRESNNGWRWRMAARELIEKDNVLSLDKISTLFNLFFRESHKLLTYDTFDQWILHTNSKSRLFGITRSNFRHRTPTDKAASRKAALHQFRDRFADIFQRRHDCIHNCDRPKVAIQSIDKSKTDKVIDDIEFLVHRCNEAFLGEFEEYLSELGFSGVTRNRVKM